MGDINRDLDRYLNKRKDGDSYTFEVPGGSWFDKVFAQQEEAPLPKEDLTPAEMQKLDAMEEELHEDEARLEAVHEYEEELEEEQAEKVGLYHQLTRFFKRNPKPIEDEPEIVDVGFDEEQEDVVDDFRALAAIQVKWLERLPRRVKGEFLDSPDYDEFTSILERRGVARRR